MKFKRTLNEMSDKGCTAHKNRLQQNTLKSAKEDGHGSSSSENVSFFSFPQQTSVSENTAAKKIQLRSA